MTKRELGQKAREYFEKVAEARAAYEAADALLDEIRKELQPGEHVQLRDKKGEPAKLLDPKKKKEFGAAVIEDNFAETNISWKPTGVRRFELEKVFG